MKKKILSVALILVLIFSFSAVFATENVTENPEMTASLEEILAEDDLTREILPDEEIEKLISDSVTKLQNNGDGNQVIADTTVFLKDYTINGNLVVFGRNVNIENLNVDGDVAIFAEVINVSNLTVNNGTTVIAGQNICLNTVSTKGNIYTACESMLGTVIAKGLYTAASDVKLTGETQVSRVYNYSGSLSIDSGNYEKVEAGIGELYIGSDVIINKDLKYSSENEGNIDASAKIGNVDFTLKEKEEVKPVEITAKDILKEKVNNVLTIVVKTAIVCGVIFLCAEGFIKKTKSEDPVKYIGFSALKGLGWIIVIPLVAIVLLLTIFGASTALVLLTIYLIIFWAAVPIVSIAIMNAIIKEKPADKKKAYGITILVALCLAILGQIPVLGGIVKTLVAFAGMGIFMGTLKINNKAPKTKVENEKVVEEAEKVEKIEEPKADDSSSEENK